MCNISHTIVAHARADSTEPEVVSKVMTDLEADVAEKVN